MSTPYKTNERCPFCGKILGNKGMLAQHIKSPARGYRAAHNLAMGKTASGCKKASR